MTDEELFLTALARGMPVEPPNDERLILCGFVGNPNKVGVAAWRPRPWRPGNEVVIPNNANGYVAVSSFRRAADGTWRRRQECFAAGRALMVDDVGTKVDQAKLHGVPPSAIVETSPHNYQWWYFLAEPLRDMSKFDSVIRAFIEQKLLGAPDPGMAGVNRVGRLPGFVNGKPQYNGWVTKLHRLEPELRYHHEDLMARLGIDYAGFRRFKAEVPPALPEVKARTLGYIAAMRWLKAHDMTRSSEPNMAGWTEIVCPWAEDEHTDKAETGASVRTPQAENGYYGAFRCHHGHCVDRGWKDLTDWIAARSAEELMDNDEAAPSFDDMQRWAQEHANAKQRK